MILKYAFSKASLLIDMFDAKMSYGAMPDIAPGDLSIVCSKNDFMIPKSIFLSGHMVMSGNCTGSRLTSIIVLVIKELYFSIKSVNSIRGGSRGGPRGPGPPDHQK